MTERIIDGHVHLVPRGLVGTRNARIGVTFHANGELEFDSGERIQYLPELIGDSAFPLESLCHVMDSHGVSHAVLMANALTDPETNLQAVTALPGRFTGAMTIPQGPEAAETVARYCDRGLRVIKFEMSAGLGYTHPNMYPDFRLDSPEMDPVYEVCARRGVTVTVDPSHIGSPSYQVEALDRVSARFPQVHFVICHLGFPDVPMAPGSAHHRRWQEMLALARRENVWFDAAALSDFYREEAYPYPGAAQLARQFMDEYGAEKLIWGSDAPGTLSQATYRQLIDIYDRSPLFSPAEKQRLFRENAIAAYHIETEEAKV